jgi:hypothetical protein
MPPIARSNALERPIFAALVLAIGVAFAGGLVGHGFFKGRESDRYVEVKGLAEREVTADLALWPLRYVSTGDDLNVAQAGLARGTRQVFAFLTRHGIDTTAVQLQALEVSDADANRFAGERGGPRFVIQQTVIVRSRTPDVVMAASQHVGELVAGGVILSSSGEYGIAHRARRHSPGESGCLRDLTSGSGTRREREWAASESRSGRVHRAVLPEIT